MRFQNWEKRLKTTVDETLAGSQYVKNCNEMAHFIGQLAAKFDAPIGDFDMTITYLKEVFHLSERGNRDD